MSKAIPCTPNKDRLNQNMTMDTQRVSDLQKTFATLGVDAKSLRDIPPFLGELAKNTADTQKLIKLLNAIHSRASIEETIYAIQLKVEGKSNLEQVVREGFSDTQHFQKLILSHAKQQKQVLKSSVHSKLNDAQISQDDLVKSEYVMFSVMKTLLMCSRLFKMMSRTKAFGLSVAYHRNPEMVNEFFKKNQQNSLVCIRDIITQEKVGPELYDIYQHINLLLLKLNHFLIQEGQEKLEDTLYVLSKQFWFNEGIEAILKTYSQYRQAHPKYADNSGLKQLYPQHKNKWVYEKPSLSELQQDMLPLQITHYPALEDMDVLQFTIKGEKNKNKVSLNLKIAGILEWFNPKVYLTNLNAHIDNVLKNMSVETNVNITESEELQRAIRRSRVHAIIEKQRSDARKLVAESQSPCAVATVSSATYLLSPMAMAGIGPEFTLTAVVKKSANNHSAASVKVPPAQESIALRGEVDPIARILKESEEADKKRKESLKTKIYVILQEKENKSILDSESKNRVEELITSLIKNPAKFPREKDRLHISIANAGVKLKILLSSDELRKVEADKKAKEKAQRDKSKLSEAKTKLDVSPNSVLLASAATRTATAAAGTATPSTGTSTTAVGVSKFLASASAAGFVVASKPQNHQSGNNEDPIMLRIAVQRSLEDRRKAAENEEMELVMRISLATATAVSAPVIATPVASASSSSKFK